MTDTINLTIDGRGTSVPGGTTILEAARSLGIEIPTLCDHPYLEPEAACRMCVVEVKGARVLSASCVTPVVEGMVVQTASPRVLAARRMIVELLVSNHPADCMTCDTAGACELQALAYQFGVKSSRFQGTVRQFPVMDSNPFIVMDLNKCILCRRCTRACAQIQGRVAINIGGRGFNSKVIAGMDVPMEESICEFCGQCVAYCPVDALTVKIAQGRGRTWEMEKVATTCNYCGVGCGLDLNVKDHQVVQVTSNWDTPVNNGALCVKGRFGFDFINHPDRLTTPLIRRNGQFREAGWDEALDLVAERLVEIKERAGSDALGVLASAKCTNEENYLIQKFARAVLGTNNVDHCARL